MTSASITDTLNTPLGPDWTVDGLADQLLEMVAAEPADSGHEFVLVVDDSTERQVCRLIRPLLAHLATKSASETGVPVSLYGGRLSFERVGLGGSVWVVGEFENRPGNVRVALRRACRPVMGNEAQIPDASSTRALGVFIDKQSLFDSN